MDKLVDTLVGEIGSLVSLLGTIYMFGLLIGSLCGGYINDKFGRKKESSTIDKPHFCKLVELTIKKYEF